MGNPAGRRRPPSAVAVVALVVHALAAYAHPTTAQATGTAPAAVFARPISVRSAGLNGAGAALVGHAGAVFSNPAGIATLRHIGVEAAYRSTSTDGRFAAAALAWRLRQFDIGVAVGYFDFGTDPSATPVPGLPVVAGAHERAGVGSLVYRFGIIALGGSGKYVQRTLDESPESAVSADAGLAIAIFDIMAIGFSMQNIGGNWREESTVSMPGITRLGMTMNYVDPLETFRLLSTLELQWPEGRDFRVVLGGEGGIVVMGVGLFCRAAYGTVDSGSTVSHIAYGASMTMARFAFDYAYQGSDLNGEPAHRLGIRLAL